MGRVSLFAVGLLAVGAVFAEEMEVEVNAITEKGVGESLGKLRIEPSRFEGVLIRPDLKGLEPGLHGFHVHEKPDCGPGEKDGESQAGLAAGGHFDPKGSGRHEGPYGEGHLGDLPLLPVAADGTAETPLLAPRLSLDDLRGRAIVVHSGGDNYSDQPKELGGGGSRVACGVVR